MRGGSRKSRKSRKSLKKYRRGLGDSTMPNPTVGIKKGTIFKVIKDTDYKRFITNKMTAGTLCEFVSAVKFRTQGPQLDKHHVLSGKFSTLLVVKVKLYNGVEKKVHFSNLKKANKAEIAEYIEAVKQTPQLTGNALRDAQDADRNADNGF